jgi:hypothetical protein
LIFVSVSVFVFVFVFVFASAAAVPAVLHSSDLGLPPQRSHELGTKSRTGGKFENGNKKREARNANKAQNRRDGMEPPVLRLPRHRLIFPFLLLLLAVSFPPSSFVQSEDDMECLQTFHSSVTDASGSLSSWNFRNVSKGSVCSFDGVNCWNALENKVLNLKLGGFGLSGSFPRGLNLCSSLQGIDLSQNKFSGDIPSDICKDLPYITDMDLSGNEFSGNVPEGFQDCVYLNSLKLQENRLTGELPWQIGILPRLTVLDLSGN